MKYTLTLYYDVIPEGTEDIYLMGKPRAIYLLDGEASIEYNNGSQALGTDQAWVGQEQIGFTTKGESKILRWELQKADDPKLNNDLYAAPRTKTEVLLSETVELEDGFDWMFRCDKVSFPPGSIADTHSHQGPGIRYLISGSINIEQESSTEKNNYQVGDAWKEDGRDNLVRALMDDQEPTVFVRGFIIPRICKSKGSTRFLNPQKKQQGQTYKILRESYINI